MEYVIHYGPARNIVSKLQEAGRGGRNGKQAHNIEGRHLIHCDRSLKTTLKTDSCLRVGMYSGFDETIEPSLSLHVCCSNCYKHCDCGDNFQEALCELQNTLTSSTFTLFDCSGHISHGFSSQLITELTSNVQFIFYNAHL